MNKYERENQVYEALSDLPFEEVKEILMSILWDLGQDANEPSDFFDLKDTLENF